MSLNDIYVVLCLCSTTDQYDTLLIQLKHCVAEVKCHLMLIPDHITAAFSNHSTVKDYKSKKSLKRRQIFLWPALTRYTKRSNCETITVNHKLFTSWSTRER